MGGTNRRGFLKTAAVGTAALSAASYARAAGANERFTVGVIGPGGMGTAHVRTLVSQNDVTISHVCDVDRTRLAAAVKNATPANSREPAGVTDLRRVLDQRPVDAVFIA